MWLAKVSLQEARNKILARPPFLSVVVLNWNRRELLKRTLYSLLATTPADAEFFVVDNASTDGSREWIENFARYRANVHAICLGENLGGEAINPVLERCEGRYILISENDMEYRPGWFVELLATLEAFPEIGQLSPLSPFPESTETWGVKPHHMVETKAGHYFEAAANVGTSCVIRRKLIRRGVRMENLSSPDGKVRMPADAKFSEAIKAQGFRVAWSEKAWVTNLGHQVEQWRADPDYYLDNWRAKARFSIDGLGRLQGGELDVGILCQELESLQNRYRLLQRHVSDREVWRRIGVIPDACRLYVDEGEGFREDRSLIGKLDPSCEEFACEFDLTGFPDVKALRWDPVEGERCELLIESVEMDGKALPLPELAYSPHEILANGWVRFTTRDPQVIISTVVKMPLSVKLTGRWRVVTL